VLVNDKLECGVLVNDTCYLSPQVRTSYCNPRNYIQVDLAAIGLSAVGLTAIGLSAVRLSAVGVSAVGLWAVNTLEPP
jgi:hypothetical protein